MKCITDGFETAILRRRANYSFYTASNSRSSSATSSLAETIDCSHSLYRVSPYAPSSSRLTTPPLAMSNKLVQHAPHEPTKLLRLMLVGAHHHRQTETAFVQACQLPFSFRAPSER